jgi:NAD(P)-dependent dehydrogenase (short-subunit alcohol dehydrogenase family)
VVSGSSSRAARPASAWRRPGPPPAPAPRSPSSPGSRLFDAATPHLDPGGSITLTSGTASHRDTAAAIPAGRVGEPDDIARAYLYCLTQPFATGSILTVDGGTVLA